MLMTITERSVGKTVTTFTLVQEHDVDEVCADLHGRIRLFRNNL